MHLEWTVTMLSRLTYIFFVILSLSTGAQAQTQPTQFVDEDTSQPLSERDPKRPDYLVFEVPGLPVYGSHYHSWYVLRGSLLWTPTGTLDLKKITWPKWELTQVPPALSYSGSNDPEIVVYDKENQEIERIHLKKAWAPQLYQVPPGKPQPHHFRVEMATQPERVRLISKNYNWPNMKEVFKCDIEVIDVDADKAKFESKSDSLVGEGPADTAQRTPPIEENPKVKLCIESLQGIVKNAGPEKQWYIDINWPKPQTRRSQMYISEIERSFKSGLSKHKHVLITHRGTGRFFAATAGLTLIEKLEMPFLETASLPNKDWHGEIANSEQGIMPVGDFQTRDGGKLIVFGFASDTIKKRSVDSPQEFSPPINIQFVKAPEPTPQMRQTDFREERTGLAGFTRPWFLSVSGDYHTLKSGRGEEGTSLNFPTFEGSWRSPYYNLDPFATLQTGLIHYDAPLALQEGQIGARWRWRPHLQPTAGYFTYSLRGRNPGSTRLGSVDGPSLGLYSIVRIEDFIVRGWIQGIYTEPFSYDTYLELSKIVDRGSTDRGLFLGLFIGYTAYRAEIRNLLNQYETFSENRFRIGVTIGFAGPEYMADTQIVVPSQVTGLGDKNTLAALRDPDVKAILDSKVAAQGRAENLSTGTTKTSDANQMSTRNRINFRVDPIALRYREMIARIDIRIGNQWTLGPALGFYSSTGQTGSYDTQATIYRAGLRANWYPSGVFRSGWYIAPQLGQLLATMSASNSSTNGSTSFIGTEYQVLAGYHWFWNHFNLNLGAGYLGGTAPSKAVRVVFANGSSVDTDLGPIPLSGLASEMSLGWSF
jgi:hypothetical protein